MSNTKQYIAVDLGAESGRVMLGSICDSKLELKEIHRFGNGPVEQDASLRWDFGELFSNIKEGIAKAVKVADRHVCGIGVDSWGVDFGLIDEAGELIENPYHYRDSRTDEMMDKAFGIMGKRELYDNSGIQFMQFNTVYQLLAAKTSRPELLEKASKLIFTADLVSYHLCGRAFAEYSLASTSQLMDMSTKQWSKETFEKLSLPLELMPKVVTPGTVVGRLKDKLAKEFGCESIDIIAVGSHDTASAVAAVPASQNNWAYLSSGTWSLMGLEIPNAAINDETYKYQFTNEGGIANTVRLLKNIMGLWIVQECKRQWQSEGNDLSYSQITQMAQAAEPFKAFIDPNDKSFFAPGGMPERINKYLIDNDQPAIDEKGQIVRVVLESLALNYRWVIEKLEEISGSSVDILYIVGGGIQNELLCQFAANATGKKVVTGPIEATASGNIIMQAIANGQIESLQKAREVVANSFELKTYLPQDVQVWDLQHKKTENVFNQQTIGTI
ncbi:MAG: rhamnulokinase [Sedimentisphaerales bacterium]|nr:rhamnulokinase [Sedimentisphaerales bacterium]